MKLYEFICTLVVINDVTDTYYQLVVAENDEEAVEKFLELTSGMEIIEDSVQFFEITEIDGYKIVVEE